MTCVLQHARERQSVARERERDRARDRQTHTHSLTHSHTHTHSDTDLPNLQASLILELGNIALYYFLPSELLYSNSAGNTFTTK
jgi:hypothetical protein